MSYQSEWQPKAGELLEKIVNELGTKDGATSADSSAGHKDMVNSLVANLSRAIGPVFETYTAVDGGYTATQTKAQATFFFTFITDAVALIAAGFETRVRDQELSAETDLAMDDIISRFGADEYPATVDQMISRGQELELQVVLSNAMKNAANALGDVFFDSIAEAAIKRSAASSHTHGVLSMFHNIVEVSIAGNRRNIATSKGPIEATLLAENVIKVDFGSPRAIQQEATPPSPPENIAQ